MFRQFDLRQPHSCSSTTRCPNVLINLTGHIGPASEVKCIQVHPLYPDYMIVGGSDPYARLYDMRMLTLTDSTDSRQRTTFNPELQPPSGCVTYFCPGHIPPRLGRQPSKKHRHYVTTYLTFSPDGQSLLHNLGGEHVYMYKIWDKQPPLVYSAVKKHSAPDVSPTSDTNGLVKDLNGFVAQNQNQNGHSVNGHSTNGRTNLPTTSTHNASLEYQGSAIKKLEERLTTTSPPLDQELSASCLELKLLGNDAFSNQNYFEAVTCYNKALVMCPNSAVLYANRAAALLKRNWLVPCTFISCGIYFDCIC